METLKSSTNPEAAISRVTYAGQPAERRMFRYGYSDYMNILPVLHDNDRFLNVKVDISAAVMGSLADELKVEALYQTQSPDDGMFARTILAIEDAEMSGDTMMGDQITKEGSEIVLAHWGKHFTTPVHGHAPGFIYEHLINGKLLVNLYQYAPGLPVPVVRPLRSVIVTDGVIASVFNRKGAELKPNRTALIHNFTALEPSATLHYLPEHTRDGRDNQFPVEYFENTIDLDMHVRQVSGGEAIYAKPGTVMLVRSANVPEYGDHYIIVTGPPVLKPNGLRPQDEVIIAPRTSALLDQFRSYGGAVLLQLDDYATEAFFKFHNITVQGGVVTFPNP